MAREASGLVRSGNGGEAVMSSERERNGEAEQVKSDGDECCVSMNEPTIFFIYLNT